MNKNEDFEQINFGLKNKSKEHIETDSYKDNSKKISTKKKVIVVFVVIVAIILASIGFQQYGFEKERQEVYNYIDVIASYDKEVKTYDTVLIGIDKYELYKFKNSMAKLELTIDEAQNVISNTKIPNSCERLNKMVLEYLNRRKEAIEPFVKHTELMFEFENAESDLDLIEVVDKENMFYENLAIVESSVDDLAYLNGEILEEIQDVLNIYDK